MRNAAMIFILSFISFNARAQGAYVGQPSYGGTGCPAGTASASVSVDGLEIVLLTDDFVLRTGRKAGRVLGRTSCQIAVPITAPDGYQFGLVSEAHGYLVLKRGAKSIWSEETFTPATRGDQHAKIFTGPADTQVEFKSNDQQPAPEAWSPCGGSTNLRSKISIANKGEALANIDEIRYKIVVRRCH